MSHLAAGRFFLNLISTAIVIALVVIVLGAYTRLSDAGLGCPDWPGCYGRLVVPAGNAGVDNVIQMYPDRPLDPGKAWKEMLHRYAAGLLGLLILALAVTAWIRRNIPGQPFWVPLLLLGLVVFQALLGMWTVTLLLKPIVVMGHLLGGMTILLLLVWLWLSYKYGMDGTPAPAARSSMYPWAIVGLAVVYLQISLGGWTSANYAALVCADLPTCQGAWWPAMDFREGFIPWRGLGIDYEFGVLDTEARTAIHVSHRIGAVLTLLTVVATAIGAMRDQDGRVKRAGLILLLLVLIQFSLGIANVLFVVPISIATSHNAVACLLLAAMGALLFHAGRRTPLNRTGINS
jgi:cytochrome c oxidase assembly protein subunit 15